MKKKTKATIALALFAAIGAMGLTACGTTGGDNKGDDKPQHTTHSYAETIISPTCTEQGYTLHKCECGEEYKDNYVNAIGHTYEDYLCKFCNAIDAQAPITEGLRYTEINENGVIVGYSVSKGYAGNNKWIKIPSEYNGKPVTRIGDRAFYNCFLLTNLTFAENSRLTSIGDYAFSHCDNLTSIIIPNGVTSIGEEAFLGCGGLTSIAIPNSVTSIGGRAFDACSSLTSITVQEGNTVYHSAGNCLIKTESRTLIAGCKNSVIPTDGSVTSIGDSAFYDCSGLTSIAIPNGVKNIGVSAFFRCRSLTSIEIPNSVTSIEVSAFYDCRSLKSIVIPNSVTSIGGNAFDGCRSLTSIEIPNSVTSIRGCAFSGCNRLTIYCEADNKPSGWAANWNPDDRPVVWGYRMS